MRIIAGICRGRNLKAVKGTKTRPTADRVKEAVFNVLSYRVEDAVFLDLFGGTGNIGLEALSRGAKKVVFVEKSPQALRVLRENIAYCGFSEQSIVLPIDAFKSIEVLKEKQYQFNLVYLDPPYDLDILDSIMARVMDGDLLAEQGIVIMETRKSYELSKRYGSFSKTKESLYGDTKIAYYQKE